MSKDFEINNSQMVIRKIHPQTDSERLLNFDTSFSTDYIYHVKINGILIDIVEEKRDVPFQKTYPIDPIKNDINEADFAVEAEIAGNLAGFAAVKFEEWNKRVNVTSLFVAPRFRGRGVGKRLVDAVEDFARGKRARCLWLETQNVNYPAIQFYLKTGFEFCGFDAALYNPADVSPGETAFYFFKQLDENS